MCPSVADLESHEGWLIEDPLGDLISFRATDAIDVLSPEEDWPDALDFLKAISDGDEAFERRKLSRGR
jgi:hypothetical protein